MPALNKNNGKTQTFAAYHDGNDEMKEILRVASAASAISVTRNGAAPSIPERREVMSRLDELCSH